MAIGVTLAGGIIAIERAAREIPLRFCSGDSWVDRLSPTWTSPDYVLLAIPLIGGLDGFALRGLVHAALAYIGVVLGARKGAEFDLNEYKKLFKGDKGGESKAPRHECDYRWTRGRYLRNGLSRGHADHPSICVA